MKYILLVLLFMGCAKSNDDTYKYKIDQELKVVTGFYSNSEKFIPRHATRAYCPNSLTAAYEGRVINKYGGWVTAIICEDNLIPYGW